MPHPPHKSLTPLTIERVNWLIGRLKKSPHRYDQGQFCGAQGCLAGFIFPQVLGSRRVIFEDYGDLEQRLMKKLKIKEEGVDTFKIAGDWLGISRSQTNLLFNGRWSGGAEQFNRDQFDTDRESANKAIKRLELFLSSDGRI